MSRRVVWCFGRGLSIGCGLDWDVPADWHELERCEEIKRIRAALLAEMDAPGVCTRSIRQFLEFLAQRTARDWQHLFLTTNWDFLLQREILKFIPGSDKPTWLSDTHVYHLNGTVENTPVDSYRSPFLLTRDSYAERTNTVEANVAFSQMIWATTIVVVGMSFECETDRFLLHALKKVQDHLPIGEAGWVVVNPDLNALTTTCKLIQAALRGATVIPVSGTLDDWRKDGFTALTSCGLFTN